MAHLARKDGEILGCLVSSTFDGRVYAMFSGFEYERIAGVPIYFALVYYHMVQFACEVGARSIEFGAAADEAKKLRGCVGYDQSLWIRGLIDTAERAIAEVPFEFSDPWQRAALLRTAEPAQLADLASTKAS
jgi:phosphoserine aminotransferase